MRCRCYGNFGPTVISRRGGVAEDAVDQLAAAASVKVGGGSRLSRLCGWIGGVGVGGLGGLLTISHAPRIGGLAVMLIGALVAAFGYLFPRRERLDTKAEGVG